MKYIYCIPFGGFGDQLATINKAIKYCKKYKRILIIETQKSKYNVNYEDYFGFQYENVILDKNKIGLLICNSDLTIYPDIFDGKRHELIDNKINDCNLKEWIDCLFGDIYDICMYDDDF